MTVYELLNVLNAHIDYKIFIMGHNEPVDFKSMTRSESMRFKELSVVYQVFPGENGRLDIVVHPNINL